ncbi:AAA family ATPase [Aquibaculum arenosum]|uniref:AAA family ATPase n=1 Tax=Aquibaculum arenosum TaxID=3032591 RepID=A0ABT5YI37_9PROT|nr:bifunctional aminoglycoside phosphotransferase/ATP-binding protein [Fodinicurvata sp. CAU 1616]MDF2094496.1 AAA family ATPase [Fodinicurvata sp. CAU 1616]
MTGNSDQERVFAFLADPATHGLAAGEVGRIHTHVAEVFLAGDTVYKVKRAVRFAFLDFSGLEARRAACEAELRLNVRTAPDIYLDAVPICRAPDGSLNISGEGEPVEWAVKMRRFDENQTLDHLADRGTLRPEWIDELVDAVVTFHGEAERRGPPYGGAEGLDAIIDDNAEDMARLSELFAPARVERLIAAKRQALERNAALLDARRDQGWVRRCHGDLHLGNVVLWQGRPTPFDCIEFSESIGSIDVAYDLAFLLMDLEVRGLREHANRAMNRYFGRQGGVEVLAALPLMLALRAGVRAKVSGLALSGMEEGAKAQHLREMAERFFAAAEAFLADTAPPRLLAVSGLSGSGKTTLAKALAPDLGRAPGALHLRSDVMRKRLAGVTPEERLPPEAYTKESNRAVYETLFAEARSALAAGQCVVLDAVFARPGERDEAEAIAREAGVAFQGIWLDAPGESLKDRVARRVGDASDATGAVVERQLGYELGRIDWPRLDAARGPEAVCVAAKALLP